MSNTMNAPRAGWYVDPQAPTTGSRRYWDGAEWTDQTRPTAVPAAPQVPAPPAATAAPVVVVNNSGPIGVKGPNHALHLVLTVFTGGMWVPVWAFIAVRNKQRPVYQ